MMVGRLGLGFAIACVLVAGLLGRAARGAESPALGRVIVKMKPGVALARAAQDSYGVVGSEGRPSLAAEIWHVAAGSEAKIAAQLRTRSDVLYAEPDRPRRFAAVPNDPYYAAWQWNLTRINAPAAWDLTRGSPAVRVAILDSGFDTTHPDRPINLELGCDFASWPKNAQGQRIGSCPIASQDPYGHGTHVAGIVAARWNNAIDVAGIAPEARILVFRVGGADGAIWASDVADAIVMAADARARVINLSLGGPTISQYEQDAIEYAIARGALLVAAAGNCGEASDNCLEPNPIDYPAGLSLDYPDNLLAVGATTADDIRAPYSNAGSHISLAAPGGAGTEATGTPTPTDWITSLAPVSSGGRLKLAVGTSLAAPHVSAAAALILALRPDFTAAQVVAVLQGSTRHMPADLAWPNEELGFGHLDARAALETAVAPLTTTATVTATPTPSPIGTLLVTGTPSSTATPTTGATATPQPTATVHYRQLMPLGPRLSAP